MTRTSSSGSDYRTIRARLTRIGVVPSVILLALWLGFSSLTVYDGYSARVIAVGVKNASIPAVNSLAALQKERQLAMERLSRPDIDPAALIAQRARTDTAVGEMRANLGQLAEEAPSRIATRARDLDALLVQLPHQRARADAGNSSRAETFRFYNRLLDAGVNLFDTQSRVTPDLAVSQAALVATDVFRAADQMSQAASLGGAALVGGEFNTEDHLSFSALVGAYHSRMETAVPAAAPNTIELYRRLIASPDWQRLVGFENALVEHPPQRSGTFAVDEEEWRQSTNAVAEALVDIAIEQAKTTSDLGLENGTDRFVQVIAGSLAALLAVLVGIVLAARNARRLVDRTLVTRLAKLRDDTLRLASGRLPDIMSRLKRGEQIDVETELSPLEHGNDEIGQVAEAFNTAHHTAVAAAVRENQAKAGINKVFLGIAHRNQGLVHRQFKVLDELARGEEHPQRQDALLRLDHLATRARRNAENLIILAGEQPGRQWRKPVRLADVVGAAVAETELYDRIRIHPMPDVSLVGAPVGDVIHLLAELMDNATSFSSPRSEVQVYGSNERRGVLVRIEDEGLGMRPADRDDANVRLSTPPRFEDITLRGDPRLGLFVVAQLAARRGIKVVLQEAAENGTVATVLLPTEILATEPMFDTRTDFTRPAEWEEVEPRLPTPPRIRPDARNSEPGDGDSGRAGHSSERSRGNMAAFQRGTRAARRAEEPE
ncbi:MULTISPECIES: sensor histidine kinase [Saccharopolyspora]|uniref:sensor histidine kinase n=1 Tax=Saccharopolyspora TaxID=1835 RepID=UPI001F40217D|nr:nitrate- and nitrite sensing domain-containing protein [Saccharopolyspora elongata]